MFSLYTRWFHRWALLAGWAVGMVYGTVTAYNVVNPATGSHFGGSLAADPGDRRDGLHRADGVRHQRRGRGDPHAGPATPPKVAAGVDETAAGDYFADEGDPRVAPMPKSVEELAAEGKTQR